MNAILHEIDGKNHDGTMTTKVPVLFGMNFQAVSVGQELIEANVGTGGYLDASGTFSPLLLGEIEFVDASIGKMVAELTKQNLIDSTLIIITAKHGQSPIDPHRYLPIPGPSGTNGESPANLVASLLPYSESPLNPTGIGPTEDDISQLWLLNGSDTNTAVRILEANSATAGIGEIYYGPSLTTMFNAPGWPLVQHFLQVIGQREVLDHERIEGQAQHAPRRPQLRSHFLRQRRLLRRHVQKRYFGRRDDVRNPGHDRVAELAFPIFHAVDIPRAANVGEEQPRIGNAIRIDPKGVQARPTAGRFAGGWKRNIRRI
ncbi:MAG TPA: alkaline phosphatase family protein [Bryobacteraceae bacterium]|nr:alkaline phosphatase family protein [Bryobacteraceae bacterium]